MLVLDYHQVLAISRNGSTCDQQSNGPLMSVEEPGRDGGGEPDWGVADACVEAMGPNGDGFVAVRGMENYTSLRSRLLRLAQKLALMPSSERAAILKEHGLGTDVPLKDPGRAVSSFAAQLRFGSPPELKQIGPTSSDDCGSLRSHGGSLDDLGSLFKQLGTCMVEVGLLIARLCDAARSHGSMGETRLEQAILESGTAKARLIHYHSLLEQEVLSSLEKNLRKGHRQHKSASGGTKAEISKLATDSGGLLSTRWQDWHCDYGIFTVLTSPLFLNPTRVVPLEPNIAIEGGSCRKDAPMTSGLHLEANHQLPEQNSSRLLQQQCGIIRYTKAEVKEKPQRTRLRQLSSSPSYLLDLNSSVQECLSPDGHSSLTVMDSQGQTTSLVIPSDYLIIQVGEAAQLLSGGELFARAHCVLRPTSAKDISRETMAVFLQPAWNRRMTLPLGVSQERVLAAAGIATNLETHIPLLSSRWKDGCTFAEFSKETTRQYYGADGHQSRR